MALLACIGMHGFVMGGAFLVDLLSLSSLFCLCGWVGLLLVSKVGIIRVGFDVVGWAC